MSGTKGADRGHVGRRQGARRAQTGGTGASTFFTKTQKQKGYEKNKL